MIFQSVQNNIKMFIVCIMTLLWIFQPSYAKSTHQPPKSHIKSKHHLSNQTRTIKHHTILHKKKTQKKVMAKFKKKSPLTQRKYFAKKNKTHAAYQSLPEYVSKVDQSQDAIDLTSSIEERLVNYVHQTVSGLRYSSYKLGGTRFDPDRGIYVIDCSSFVDRLLKKAYPHAYFNLVNSTGTDKPTTTHYYDFFSTLSDDSTYLWNKVDDVEELKAGDILVFRSKNAFESEGRGHVMVVMDKPVRETDTFFVRVADSAPIGHSEDTRLPHVSGIGIGTMLLKANPLTGQPYAYAWKVGSRWKKNVDFAMARPLELS